MNKDQQPIPQLDDHTARFYSERAAKQRAEAAKREKFVRPSMTDTFKANEEKRLAQEAERKASQSKDPHSVHVGGPLHLPPNDPLVQRAKWEAINPGQEYPQSELERLRAENQSWQQLGQTISDIRIGE